MKICENCNQQHDGSYGSGRFCNNKCARGYSTKNKRKEINEKVSNTLKKEKIIQYCLYCEKEFGVIPSRQHHKCCSKSCAAKYYIQNNPQKAKRDRSISGRKSVENQQKRSKNEIYFAELCQNCFKSVEVNKSIFNGWDADIIIYDLKIAILWNGKWHYEQIGKKHSLEQVQNRDKIKIEEIKKVGYIPYIIKDMGRYDKKFVKSEFKKFMEYYKTIKVLND